jgi:phosphohistidine phosphatase
VELGWQPEEVVSSDSTRTTETFELMANHFSDDLTVRFLGSLYHAGPAELAAALQTIPDSVTTVMAIGHNPGWSSVVHWLTEESVGLTTANAALCHVEADNWQEAVHLASTWQLEEVLRPRDL